MSTQAHRFKKRAVFASLACLLILVIAGFVWFANRYSDRPQQTVALTAFSKDAYPENPENTSQVFGTYPHRQLIVEQLDGTRFRFLMEPAPPQASAIELTDIDLAHFVAAVPPWVKTDPDLTKIGLIDREWNRQQVRFSRISPHVRVRDGGDGFEQRALSRIDLARNCLNAGLWELLLFTTKDGEERVNEHFWFTFPLGLYKQVFERVNNLSYWSYWWSLEHWVDPSGTPIRLDRLRTVEQEWPVQTTVRWDEPVAMKGEQARKRKNILTPVEATYRDWYTHRVRFASFIPPGRYSRAHPRETQLHYLAELTGAIVRRVKLMEDTHSLIEVELAFRSSKTVNLELRPIHVRLATRTRGHVFVVMMAYRIIHELAARWQHLDVTVAEGIAELSTLCANEVSFNGKEKCNQIPVPRNSVKNLIEAANTKLPSVLPSRGVIVTTKKKLTSRRNLL